MGKPIRRFLMGNILVPQPWVSTLSHGLMLDDLGVSETWIAMENG